jgi:hypothetical protein
VADIIAEDQISTAVQLAEQAALAEHDAALAAQIAGRSGATDEQEKTAAAAAAHAARVRAAASEAAELALRPVTGAPATTSRAGASAQCAGPGCTAATTGGTTGTPGASSTTATCTAATSGCAVASDATTSTRHDIGQDAGTAEATSRAACPGAGCTAVLTATADAVADLGGRRSHSTATGETRCAGTSACDAEISAASTVTLAAPDAATSAAVSGRCADGSATGCATRASSSTDATGAAGVHATSTATCAAAGGCQTMTSGYAAVDVAEVMASCAGTACATRTEGAASHAGPTGVHSAQSRTDCVAGAGGQCAGTSRVGATDGSAQVSAACQGSAGSTCSHSFSAASLASSATGGLRATARAACGASGGAGGGWCATSAAAETDAEMAVAMAECRGSAGAGCSYHYEATGSKRAAHPSGSWANAWAHGAESGTFGGGGVMVSVKVLAEDGHAYAEATCAGASNCSTRYEAEAYAEGHFDDPQAGGTWDSWGRPHCVGGGSSGGGCGVIAIAEPGYGGGQCYGTYSSCETPGDSVFTPYAPPPGFTYDENGNLVPLSIPIGEMDEPVRVVEGECLGFLGLCAVSAMGEDGEKVQKVCWLACTAETATGEKASYNIFTGGFSGEMATTPGGSAKDTASGAESIRIARDADGDGEASATGGNWQITDGHTGTTTRAHNGTVRVSNPGGSARLSNPRTGSPFKVTCTGPCEWTRASVPGLPGGDTITIDRAWSEITGRDAAGGPGKIQFDGQGHFHFTSAEGITISAQSRVGSPSRATIYTPSNGHAGSFDIKDQAFSVRLANGYSAVNIADRAGVWGTGRLTAHQGTGGRLECSGDCTVIRPGEPSPTSSPAQVCRNCRLAEVLPGEDPTRPHGYGEVELYDYSNGVVTRTTTNGGVQSCLGMGCRFTQFNPDAQGNGGGAICETGSGAQNRCSGTNRFGDIQEALGEGRTTGLRYRNNDGTAGGRFCVESGSRGYCGEGDAGDVRGTGPWDVTGVMVDPRGGAIAAYDPTYRLPEDVASAVAEVKNPDGTPVVPRAEGDRLRPLTEIELEALRKRDPAVAAAYERDLPKPTQGRRHGAIFASLEDKSDIAEVQAKYGSSVSSAVTDFEAVVAQALADNWIDDTEWGRIAPLKGVIDEAAPGLLGRWLPAAERSSLMEYANYRGATLNDNARRLVQENPEVISQILGTAANGLSPAEQQQAAVNKIVEGQQASGSASLALSHALGTRPAELENRTEIFNQRAKAANERRYLLPGEKEWFAAEQAWLEGEKAALSEIDRQHRPAIQAAQKSLRHLDLVYVSASGNMDWHLDLTLADGQVVLSQGLQNELAGSENARQQDLADTFADVSTLTQLNYNGIRDRQYDTIASFLTEVRLPSSGYPDMAFAHAAAAAMPRLDQHYQGSDQQLSRVWANLPADEKTRIAASSVDLANVAGPPDFRSWERTFLSSAGNVGWAKSLEPGRDLDGDGTIDTNGFQDWFVRGHDLPDDWAAWTKHLSDSERAKLEQVYRENRQSVLVAVGDNVSGFLDRTVGWINDPLGSQTTRPQDFLSVVEADARNVVLGIPRAAAQGIEDVGTQVESLARFTIGTGQAVLRGDTALLESALPTGGDRSSTHPVLAEYAGSVFAMSDRWGSAVTGDWSGVRETYGEGKVLSTMVEDLTPFLPFLKFTRAPRMPGGHLDAGPLTRPDAAAAPPVVPVPSSVAGLPAVLGVQHPQGGFAAGRPEAVNVGERLGPDANCVNAVCAYGTAPSPDAVDSRDIPAATPRSHDPATALATVEGIFGGRFTNSTRSQFDRDVADSPDGTEVVVWGWAPGARASHMVYGLKAGGGFQFYDQRGRLTDEQAGAELEDLRMALVAGRGSAGRPDLSGVPPVGAPRPVARAYDPTARTSDELDGDLDSTPRPSETPAEAQARVRAADAELIRRAVDVYEAFGDTAPKINIRANDAVHAAAHTIERHGPRIPLRPEDAAAGVRTLKGRILGDAPWTRPENFSYRWVDESTMNRVVNDYLRNNWKEIRSDLALHGFHKKTFDAGKSVGEGFRNANYGKQAPPLPVYSRTSIVTVVLERAPSRGPPGFQVITAYPNGRGH